MRRLATALAFVLSVPLAVGEEILPFSISANLLAKMSNSTDTSFVGPEQIDDGAYTYILSYNRPETGKETTFARKVDYYSIRMFQWKTTYTNLNGLAQSGGVSGVKGVAALYGQRYFPNRDAFRGFGIGWNAGLASMDEQWTEATGGSVVNQVSSVVPVVSAEILFRIDINRYAYIEPVVSFSWWETHAGKFIAPFMLNLGAQF